MYSNKKLLDEMFEELKDKDRFPGFLGGELVGRCVRLLTRLPPPIMVLVLLLLIGARSFVLPPLMLAATYYCSFMLRPSPTHQQVPLRRQVR